MQHEQLKHQIKYNFSKSVSTYDTVAWVQKKCALILKNLLLMHFKNFVPKTILDIGTGTGNMALALQSKFPQSIYTLNDLSPAMITAAINKLKHKNNNIMYNIMCGDAENLDFNNHDMITANFVLQWFNNDANSIRHLYNKSKILAFTTLTEGTFSHWTKLYHALNLEAPNFNYPSIQYLNTIIAKLRPANYIYKAKQIKLKFTSPLLFVKYLRALGAHSKKQIINNNNLYDLTKIIKKFHNAIEIDYNIFFSIVERKGY